MGHFGTLGIGTTGPDRKLDVLDASNPQLRLTYTDGSVYTDFQTDASGNLTINATGTKTILSDNLEVNGNNIQDSGAASAITFDGAENTQMNGDLTIAAGKDITMTNGAGTFTETSNATTASNVATITADSLTTKNVLTLSGAALTTGNALSITGPSSGTTKTTALIAATSNIGATGTSTGMVNFTATATPTGGGSSIGLYNKLVNSNSTLANSGYGIYNTLTDAIALGNTNYGNYTLVNNTGAVSGGTKTIYGNYIDARGTGATTSPDTEVYGQYITTNASNGDVSGTVNQYGLYIANGTSSTNGTSTKYLLYVDAASGADTRYAAYFAGGNVNIQSLTASSGVYTDVNDNLTSTIPTTGAVGYWSRTGSTLSPTNGPGSDNVYTTGLLSIGSATAPTAGVAYFNGAVGIGNTAPAARLQITTAAQGEPPALGAGATGSGFILASTNNLYGLYAGVRTNGDTWLQSTRNDATATAYNILLNPSGGNVGIGTTSPLEPLDVKVGTSTHIGFFSAGSNLASLSTWNDTFSGWQTLYLNSNTTGGGNVIMNGGNVGIGTTAPLAKLSIGSGSLTDANLPAQINAGAAGEAFYGINNNGGYGLIVGYENNSDAAPTAGAMIRNISATPIYFNVSNTTNAMTILANGNVGIGTTSPPLLLSAIGGTTGYPIAIGGGAQTNGIARMGTGAQSLDFGWGGATPWGFWIQAHLNTNTSAAPLLLNPNGGNVGIGTTAPAGKLQVQTTNYDLLTSTTTVDIGAGGAGTGWARAFRTVNTSGSNGQNGAAFGALGTGATPTYAYMSIPTSDATGYDSTKILVLNNSGNVGIGTTSPAAADGSARTFQIGDRSIFQSTVGTQTLLSNNAYYDGAWKYAVSSYASAIRLNGLGTTGDITFSTAASGTAGSTISNWDTTSVRMTILNGGNVGIGTTGPGAKLEVNATTGTAANFQVTSGTASPATGGLLGLGIQNNDATSNSLSGILFSSQDTGGSLRHMGGIVSGKSDTWTAADTTTWDSFLSFWTRLNGGLETEAMRINANGNVGIGTTNPIQQVQISGASQTTAALADAGVTGGTLMLTGTNSAGGSGGALEFSALNGNGTYVPQAAIKSLLINSTTNGVGDLAFSTRNAVADVALTERMRILSGGNVGIGTTGPGAKLDVVGGSIRTDTQLISTVATGTSPLAVTSTTKVTNLNADLLDGLNSDSAYNGFVGGTIPIRHPSGYLFSNYFNMSANDVGAVTDTHLAVETGSDGYLRWQTPSELVTAQGNHVVGDQDTTRSNLDFNTQLQTGFYNFDASPTNGPGAVYGQLIVADGIDTGLQIAGGYTNNLYYRGWSSSGGAFTSWYKIWSTQNLGDYNGRIRIADIGCSSSWASSCDANGNGQTDAADALTADPADCGTGLYANGINASGTATNCSQRLDSSGTPTFSTLTTTGAINGQTISPTANFTGTVAITTTLSAGVSTLTNVTLPNSNVAPTVGIYQGGGYVQIRGGTSGFAVNNTANTVSNLLITDAGAVTIPGAFAFSGGGNFSIASAGMDVTTAGAVSGVTTLDTGLGAHELYAMNQDVQTSDTVNFSDIHVIRTGSATTGVVYLGNAGTHYLYFDGTKYNLVSADLALGGAITGATTIAASSTITGTTLNGTTGINTGATAGTNRIDASGNLVNIGTITSGAINSQTISSAASFNGTVAVATSTTTPFYNVTAADGNGICFWQDCATYKIHMGNAAENHYGPVTGYSIKTNMSNAGWGWTWGATGATPVIAMEATGKMQIAGNFVSMGSVGIGTTSINASNKLDVIGGGILISSADGHADASLHISTAYGGNGRTTQISNATGALNIMSGDNASWYSWGVGSDNIWRINSGTSFSSGGLNINSSNNVGIGTTSPIQQTQISGSSQTTAALTDAGNTGGTLLLSGTASTAGSGGTLDFSALNGNGTYVPQAAIKSLLTNGSTNGVGDLAFSTRNAVGDTALTERMRILSGGNVGIGTTAPLTPLHVSGAALATFTGTSRGILSLVNPYGTGTSYQAIDFLYSANNLPVARIAPLVSPTGTFLTFGTSNSYGTGITNTAMVISPTGNVGIGTTAPASQLSVGGAGISGAGVYGIGSSFGVYATSSTGIGVYGTNGSAGGVGVYGENTSSGVGGYFSSATGLGVEIGKGGITLDSSGTIQFVTGGTSIDSTSGAMRANVSTKFAVLGGFIQEDVPAASGTFAICHTTNGAQANAALNDCVNPPTDIAEFYPGTSDLQPGDLVSLVPNNGSFSQYRVVKSTSPYDPNLIGAVSTTPTGPNGSPLGENTIPDSQSPQAIGLSGRVPMKVSLENGPIHVNDYLTSSSTPGVAMKATKASRVVGKALENYDGSVQVSLGSRDQERVRRESNITVNQDPVDPPPGIGKILVFTNLTWYDPDVQLANDGNLTIAPTVDDNFKVQNNGQDVSRIGAFAELVVAQIKAGLINAQVISTNSLAVVTDNITVAGQKLSDYIGSIVDQKLAQNSQSSIVNGQLSVNVISPLSTDENAGIKIKLNDNQGKSKLEIQNASGSAVASIDSQGNASISGQLSANGINTKDATISGTLHAGKIVADDIEGLNAKIATLSSQTITNNYYIATPSANSQSSIVNGQSATGSANQSASDSGQLVANPYALDASASASFNDLFAKTATFEQGLMSFGSTSLFEASVADRLFVGSQLSIADNSINVLGGNLKLQPLSQGGVSFEGDLITIDTNGNLKVNGNADFAKDVNIKGTLAANIIAPLPDQDLKVSLASDSGKLEVQNASQSGVLSINNKGDLTASGAGTFNKLNLSIVPQALAISDTEVVASSSAGTIILKANKPEITIDNPIVTANSLIYITPVGQTYGQSLYLSRQVPNVSFTVGIGTQVVHDIKFNYLIIN